MYVLEIQRLDLAADSEKSDLYKWLLVSKDALEITPLTFLAMDSGGGSQERFFKQGYLSFDFQKAVFIHESSSMQHILEPGKLDVLPEPLHTLISTYFNQAVS